MSKYLEGKEIKDYQYDDEALKSMSSQEETQMETNEMSSENIVSNDENNQVIKGFNYEISPEWFWNMKNLRKKK